MTYINSIGAIAPQNTIENGHYVCVEPFYREFINPVQLRRMSRILKMGLGASSICIRGLPESEIDAIIVGTGLACIIDLENVLFSVLNGNEQGISPISFVNSSHNTVAAQIAMMHKITGYNNTYCHRGASFESALRDALLLLYECEAKCVLVGGIDEYSQHYPSICSEDYKMNNAMLGEGAVFFILENKRRDESFAQLVGVQCFLTKNDEINYQFIMNEISTFLQKHSIKAADIDIFVSGKNSNCVTNSIYEELEFYFFQKAETIFFKHLCGEYMTATAFALDIAARKMKEHKNKIALIYNHYNHTNHSIILLKNAFASQ